MYYLALNYTAVNVLTVNNLSKNYSRIQALQNVSFEVPPGSVFGILGPNGSGKTTMLGIITDVLKPTSGNVLFFDKAPSSEYRKKIGTLLETPNFYHYLSAEKNLAISAAIKERGSEEIPSALEKVNLYERRTSKFSTYSLGMKQRLAIAAALLGNPEVLIFDEPTNGLDPVGIAEIRELIKRLANEGKTIIMASHMLDEVEKVCTHVAILKKGKLLTAGSVNEVLVNEDIVEVAAADMNSLEAATRSLQGYKNIQRNGTYIHISYASGTADLAHINQTLFSNHIVLNHLLLKRKSLETKFLELTNN